MKNLFFTAAFDGAPFHGWQLQPNGDTVQGELLKAWYSLTGEKPNIIGCGRTDAGVHATEYCFNVRTSSSIPPESFPAALNTKLPREIAAFTCKEVPFEFNARYNAQKKEYRYIIYNSEVLSPFLYKRAFHYKYKLDESLMNKAAGSFLGEHDFSAFCSAGATVDSKVREIYEASVIRDGDTVTFSVTGNGFLYNMVRIMAGTLINVSEGKIAMDDIPTIIDSRNRDKAGITAPPQGLYLHKVFYGSEFDEA